MDINTRSKLVNAFGSDLASLTFPIRHPQRSARNVWAAKDHIQFSQTGSKLKSAVVNGSQETKARIFSAPSYAPKNLIKNCLFTSAASAAIWAASHFLSVPFMTNAVFAGYSVATVFWAASLGLATVALILFAARLICPSISSNNYYDALKEDAKNLPRGIANLFRSAPSVHDMRDAAGNAAESGKAKAGAAFRDAKAGAANLGNKAKESMRRTGAAAAQTADEGAQKAKDAANDGGQPAASTSNGAGTQQTSTDGELLSSIFPQQSPDASQSTSSSPKLDGTSLPTGSTKSAPELEQTKSALAAAQARVDEAQEKFSRV